MQAYAIDPRADTQQTCVIRDMSRHGCRIISRDICSFPDVIDLIPNGFQRPLRGKIVWRDGQSAGVVFTPVGLDARNSDAETLFDG